MSNFLTFCKKNSIYLVLIALVFTGVVLRATPFLTFSLSDDPHGEYLFGGDARWYHREGYLMSRVGFQGLLNPENDVYQNETLPSLTGFRTPLFPYFIGMFYGIFGNKELPIRMGQVALDASLIVVIFFATKYFSRNKDVALVAATIYTFSPLAIIYSTSLHPDGILCAIFTIFCVLFSYTLQKKKPWLFVAVGIVLGISTLVKPVLMYFYPVIVLVILFHEYKTWKWKEKIVACLLVLGCFIITIAPWQLRNWYVFGHYSLTYQQGRELLVWRVGTCQAWTQKKPIRKLWDTIQLPYLNIKDPFVRSHVEEKAALQYILNNKVKFTSCMIRGMGNFFYTPALFVVGYPTAHQYEYGATGLTNNLLKKSHLSQKTLLVLSRVYSVGLFTLFGVCILGFILMWRKKEYRSFVIFSLLTIIYFTVTTGVDGYSRYRFPLSGLIAILSACSGGLIVQYIRDVFSKFIKKNA